MPNLTVQAWDVPCYGHNGTVLAWMQTMLWSGLVTRFWVPDSIARTLPSGLLPVNPQLQLNSLIPSTGGELESTATEQAAQGSDDHEGATATTAAAQGTSTATGQTYVI